MLKLGDKQDLAGRVQEHLDGVIEIRPFPAAVTELLSATQDPNATASTFEKIIECDPALAVKLLRVANSPLYGLRHEVRSIAHATAFLGVRQLRNLALSVAGGTMFAQGETAHKQREALWDHSLGCATVARLLAKLVGGFSPDEAFLGGIFHDVGKLLLLDVVPDEFGSLCQKHHGPQLAEKEKQLFGTTHEEIGLKSAHAWQLTQEIKTAIAFHHRPTSAPLHTEFAAAVHLANGLAKAWGIGSPAARELGELIDAQVMSRLSIDSQALTPVRDEAREVHSQLAVAISS